jgi:hypothetical protein
MTPGTAEDKMLSGYRMLTYADACGRMQTYADVC